jgi:hypothetical protein
MPPGPITTGVAMSTNNFIRTPSPIRSSISSMSHRIPPGRRTGLAPPARIGSDCDAPDLSDHEPIEQMTYASTGQIGLSIRADGGGVVHYPTGEVALMQSVSFSADGNLSLTTIAFDRDAQRTVLATFGGNGAGNAQQSTRIGAGLPKNLQGRRCFDGHASNHLCACNQFIPQHNAVWLCSSCNHSSSTHEQGKQVCVNVDHQLTLLDRRGNRELPIAGSTNFPCPFELKLNRELILRSSKPFGALSIDFKCENISHSFPIKLSSIRPPKFSATHIAPSLLASAAASSSTQNGMNGSSSDPLLARSFGGAGSTSNFSNLSGGVGSNKSSTGETSISTVLSNLNELQTRILSTLSINHDPTVSVKAFGTKVKPISPLLRTQRPATSHPTVYNPHSSTSLAATSLAPMMSRSLGSKENSAAHKLYKEEVTTASLLSDLTQLHTRIKAFHNKSKQPQRPATADGHRRCAAASTTVSSIHNSVTDTDLFSSRTVDMSVRDRDASIDALNPPLPRGPAIRSASGKYSIHATVPKNKLKQRPLNYLTNSTFDSTIHSIELKGKAIVILCTASFLPACGNYEKLFEQLFAELTIEQQEKFALFGFDQAHSRLLIDRYNLRTAPALIIYYNGNLVRCAPLIGQPILHKRRSPCLLIIEKDWNLQSRIESSVKSAGQGGRTPWNSVLAINYQELLKFNSCRD